MGGPDGRDVATARLTASVAAYGLGVDVEDIIESRRGPATAAFARQVAMYLSHVCFELSLARIAHAFGRDRSTVAHACHTIEDRRDDADFDAWMAALETMVREAPPPARHLRPEARS